MKTPHETMQVLQMARFRMISPGSVLIGLSSGPHDAPMAWLAASELPRGIDRAGRLENESGEVEPGGNCGRPESLG